MFTGSQIRVFLSFFFARSTHLTMTESFLVRPPVLLVLCEHILGFLQTIPRR